MLTAEYVPSIFRKTVCFQVTSENAKTRSWVTKTVWQRIPGRRARNSETPTTITVHSIPRNDQLPLTGGPQVLTTDDVGCVCATFRHVQRSCSMKALVHRHGELELYSVGDIERIGVTSLTLRGHATSSAT